MPDLRELIQKFLEATTEKNPEVSTFLGTGECMDRLPDPSPEGLEAKKDFVRVWKERFAALDTRALGPEERLDIEVFLKGSELWLYNLEILNQTRHNPDPLEELSFLLFTQTRRQARDEEGRFLGITRRLNGLGEYLEAFHRRIETADVLWTEMARKVAATFPTFLETILDRSRGVVSAGLDRDLREAIHHAHEALESHLAWLDRIPTRENLWALDEERFSTLLRLKAIEPGPEEIEVMGLEALATFKAEHDRLAREVDPALSPEEVTEVLRKDRPDNFATLLEEVRSLALEARAFIEKNRLAAVHAWETLEIEPTPPFFRPLVPTTAYFSPVRHDEVQIGTYAMTPPAAPSLLDEYCRSTLPLIATHEGYPGHHHHIVTVNRLSNILREGGILGFPTDPTCWFGAELVEGWAYYGEALMLERGFYNTPAVRLQFQKKLIRRAARMVVDVRLSSGRMTFDQAAAYLQENTGMAGDLVLPEIQRYTRNPGYQLGHLLGKMLLENLRAQRQKAEGDAFDVYAFHNRILQAGVVPVKLLAGSMAKGQ